MQQCLQYSCTLQEELKHCFHFSCTVQEELRHCFYFSCTVQEELKHFLHSAGRTQALLLLFLHCAGRTQALLLLFLQSAGKLKHCFYFSCTVQEEIKHCFKYSWPNAQFLPAHNYKKKHFLFKTEHVPTFWFIFFNVFRSCSSTFFVIYVIIFCAVYKSLQLLLYLPWLVCMRSMAK